MRGLDDSSQPGSGVVRCDAGGRQVPCQGSKRMGSTPVVPWAARLWYHDQVMLRAMHANDHQETPHPTHTQAHPCDPQPTHDPNLQCNCYESHFWIPRALCTALLSTQLHHTSLTCIHMHQPVTHVHNGPYPGHALKRCTVCGSTTSRPDFMGCWEVGLFRTGYLSTFRELYP